MTNQRKLYMKNELNEKPFGPIRLLASQSDRPLVDSRWPLRVGRDREGQPRPRWPFPRSTARFPITTRRRTTRCAASILTVATRLIVGSALIAQQPATSEQLNVKISTQYVNGVAPGYRPTPGAGLTLTLGPGTAFCGGQIQNYTGGSLTLVANSTNYIYLDSTASCMPNSNATGYTSTTIPIATVTTGPSAITAVTDVRTSFVSGPVNGSGVPGGANGAVQYNSSGSFAGDATNFSYNSTSHSLAITGTVTAAGFTSTGTGSGSTQWMTGTLGPGSTGSVMCGANTGNIFACSDNGGVPISMAMIAGDLGGVQGGERVAGLRGIPISTTSPTNGQVYSFNSAANQWQPTSLSGSFSAGGDLSGSSTSQTVIGLEGRPVASTAPAANQVLAWNGSSWAPTTSSTGGSTPIPFYAMGDRNGSQGFIANQVRVIGMTLPASVTFSHLTIYVQTADSNASDLYSWGIYNSSGSLVAHVAPRSLTAAGDTDVATVEGSVTLSPGKYYFAYSGNAAVAAFAVSAFSYFNFANGYLAANSGAVLPATMSPPADSITSVNFIADLALH